MLAILSLLAGVPAAAQCITIGGMTFCPSATPTPIGWNPTRTPPFTRTPTRTPIADYVTATPTPVTPYRTATPRPTAPGATATPTQTPTRGPTPGPGTYTPTPGPTAPACNVLNSLYWFIPAEIQGAVRPDWRTLKSGTILTLADGRALIVNLAGYGDSSQTEFYLVKK